MQFAQKVVRWQARHGRRDLPWQGTRDPYRIWLSEVMLQQTQVSTVIPYYERFIQKYPTPQALARASEEQVLELWSGLGYYARGRNLHRAARLIAQQGFPRTAEAMAELWHKRIREELGIAGADSPELSRLFRQEYQGARYSFGYPACPNLEDQEKLFTLLEPARIDVELSEEYQLEPEQSTSAIIVHHPEAKYFSIE